MWDAHLCCPFSSYKYFITLFMRVSLTFLEIVTIRNYSVHCRNMRRTRSFICFRGFFVYINTEEDSTTIVVLDRSVEIKMLVLFVYAYMRLLYFYSQPIKLFMYFGKIQILIYIVGKTIFSVKTCQKS